MPRTQVKPLPQDLPQLDRSRFANEEKSDLDEIVRIVSRNFSRDLAEIMAAQERRRRPRD